MYLVKAWVDAQWINVGWYASKDDAEMKQDAIWLIMPEFITEIEFRGFN